MDSFKLQHFGQQRSNICFISVDIFVWKCTGIIVLEINEHITSGNSRHTFSYSRAEPLEIHGIHLLNIGNSKTGPLSFSLSVEENIL